VVTLGGVQARTQSRYLPAALGVMLLRADKFASIRFSCAGHRQ
jgi:hypothetical protein